MGNSVAKALLRTKAKTNTCKVYEPLPVPLLPMAVWQNNIQTFLQTHITQLQHYAESEVTYVQRRLERFEDGSGIPFRSNKDECYLNAVAEIVELMRFVGDWQGMNVKAIELVSKYVAQERYKDLEEIAFVFCVLVIEPQILKGETR